ncbi:MAG: bacterial transcriptional activator domain-containing protein, partial [Anaerolineales bacterium]|nr:bacterial transcriptional activator domain-containing protein [Anaerolineales bacterium]
IWLDTAEFERLITQGNAIFRQDPTQALPLYREALALYQGDYLQEYLYEEWCTEERERLLTLYLRTAERLAATLLEQQGWEEVIEVAQAILARDDCWENAYRALMLAYAHLGNRTQVIRTYQRCGERLATELGVEPSPATTELYFSLV